MAEWRPAGTDNQPQPCLPTQKSWEGEKLRWDSASNKVVRPSPWGPGGSIDDFGPSRERLPMYRSRPTFAADEKAYKYGVRDRWLAKTKTLASTPVAEFIDNGFGYAYPPGPATQSRK